MSAKTLKGVGIACFVVCAVLLFVAWERYEDNAKKVAAAKSFMDSTPLGGMMKTMTGNQKIEPATPAATKYALVFGVLAAIGGIVCIVMAGKSVSCSGLSGGPGATSTS